MKAAVPAFLAAALLLGAALPGAVSAKDLGVRGATWPVAEPDPLAQIEARLVEMEDSGELARLERDARANARLKLEEPDSVQGPGLDVQFGHRRSSRLGSECGRRAGGAAGNAPPRRLTKGAR